MTLYLIRGLPGSGKSTLANHLKNKGLVDLVYEADQFFTGPDGVYRYMPELIAAAHTWCQTQVELALRAGKDVAVANTFTRHWEMKPYLDVAKELLCPVVKIICEGEFQNVHNVPADVIQRMKDRWEN